MPDIALGMQTMKNYTLPPSGLNGFLSDIEAASEDFVTAYVEPACFPDYIADLSLEPRYNTYTAEMKEAINTEAVIQAATKYKTGAVVFWSDEGNSHVVMPPFLVVENRVSTGKPDTTILHEIVNRQYIIAVIIVAWGSYAIGIFDAGNLVESKIGTGHIHKKHKKGGSSQKRFARRTEEQKKDFLRRVGNRIEERFGRFAPDYIFFGGNRLIVKPLLQECRYLQTKNDKISARFLSVRYADREALACSIVEITKCVVFTF